MIIPPPERNFRGFFYEIGIASCCRRNAQMRHDEVDEALQIMRHYRSHDIESVSGSGLEPLLHGRGNLRTAPDGEQMAPATCKAGEELPQGQPIAPGNSDKHGETALARLVRRSDIHA